MFIELVRNSINSILSIYIGNIACRKKTVNWRYYRYVSIDYSTLAVTRTEFPAISTITTLFSAKLYCLTLIAFLEINLAGRLSRNKFVLIGVRCWRVSRIRKFTLKTHLYNISLTNQKINF